MSTIIIKDTEKLKVSNTIRNLIGHIFTHRRHTRITLKLNIDLYPRSFRACLRIGENDELKMKIVVASENLRYPLTFHLNVSKEVLDEILKYVSKCHYCIESEVNY